MGWLICGVALLIGIDLRISFGRWKRGVTDLNPIVQASVKRMGPIGGVIALGTLNLLLLLGATMWGSVPLAMLFGGKTVLCALQIRSMEIEHSNPR